MLGQAAKVDLQLLEVTVNHVDLPRRAVHSLTQVSVLLPACSILQLVFEPPVSREDPVTLVGEFGVGCRELLVVSRELRTTVLEACFLVREFAQLFPMGLELPLVEGGNVLIMPLNCRDKCWASYGEGGC